MYFLLMLFGFGLLGWMFDDWDGVIGTAFFGACVGLILEIFMQRRLQQRLGALEQRLQQLELAHFGHTVESAVVTPTVSDGDTWTEDVAAEPVVNITAAEPVSTTVAVQTPPASARNELAGVSVVDDDGWGQQDYQPSPLEQSFARGFAWLKNFFLAGNPIVKIGALVLLMGVGFLLKYAAERAVLPIEWRFSGIAALGVVVLAIGWRLRSKHSAYALVLQATGVGVLYLTVFTAARFFSILPLSLALFLMIGLVVLSSVLAVLQNTLSFAVIATAGGFLAPILVSTGAGNHQVLFAYYAILNVGILGMAWFKSWRLLNLLGFLFTFVIGIAWGALRYEPELFWSTEPYLLLFFAMYLSIAVLYGLRRAVQLKSYVDGSLVFGLPAISFAIQSYLVTPFMYGRAFSALALGAIYLLLAKNLWRREGAALRLLSEAFLILGIIFASITIPLLLHGHWTVSLWALEGAGLVWLGLRQQRISQRLFGLLIIIVSVLLTLRHPIEISSYYGLLISACAGFIASYLYSRHATQIIVQESWLSSLCCYAAALLWVWAGFACIELSITWSHLLTAKALFVSASVLLLSEFAARTDWRAPRYFGLAMLPMLLYAFVYQEWHQSYDGHYFAWPQALCWFVLLSSHYRLLSRLEQTYSTRVCAWAHVLGLWAVFWLLFRESEFLIWQLYSPDWGGTWVWWLQWSLPWAGLLLLLSVRNVVVWPLTLYRRHYLFHGLVPVTAALTLLAFQGLLILGDPAPLSYLPILNPVEMLQLMAAGSVIYWGLLLRRQQLAFVSDQARRLCWYVTSVFGLLFVTVMIGRAVHFYAEVPFTRYSLLHSGVFHAVLSVAWSMIAFSVMGISARRGLRLPWLLGAGLLATVLVKLFLFDLADSGSLTRIVSFLVVGGLMLVFGYFSPLPAKSQETAT